jgi:hypothetical protein
MNSALDRIRRQVRHEQQIAEIFGVDAKHAASRAIQFIGGRGRAENVPEVIKHVVPVLLCVPESEIAPTAGEPVARLLWQQAHRP